MAGRTLQFLAGALQPALRAGARHAEYAGRDRPRHHGRGAAATRAPHSANSPPAAGGDRSGRVDRRRGADGRGDRGVRVGTGLRLPARRSAGAGRRRGGLAAALAEKLARETVAGSGELLHRSPLDAAALRENVTSPGGTTAAALSVLMGENGLAALMERPSPPRPRARANSRAENLRESICRLGTATARAYIAVSGRSDSARQGVSVMARRPARKPARKPHHNPQRQDASTLPTSDREKNHRGLPGAPRREADRADRACRDRRGGRRVARAIARRSSPRRWRSSPLISKTPTAPCSARISATWRRSRRASGCSTS